MSTENSKTPDYLPTPSTKKNAYFQISAIAAIIINFIAGVLNYALLSKGAILESFYDIVVSSNLSMAIIGLGGLGVALSIIAYLLSFDFRRTKRPIAILYPLFATLIFFIAASLLGSFEIHFEDILLVCGGLAACLLGPFIVFLAEKSIGMGSLKSAESLIAAEKPIPARAAAHTALLFVPNNKSALISYGLGLAGSDKHDIALPYLRFAAENNEKATPNLALALANAYEQTGDKNNAVKYLTQYKDQVSPSSDLTDRLVSLWIDTGEDELAIDAIHSMPNDNRKFWRDKYLGLLLKARDENAAMEVYREVKSEDYAPFAQSLTYLEKILSVFPTNKDALHNIIEVLKGAKNPDHAASRMKELLTLDEKNSEIRRKLIDYFWTREQKEDVIYHLNKLLLLNEATTQEKLVLLEENYSHGDYFRVEELIQSESDLQNNSQALGTLALALFSGERYEEALQKISEAKKNEITPELTKNLDGLAARIRKNILKSELDEFKQKSDENSQNLAMKFDYLDRLLAFGESDKVVWEFESILKSHPDEAGRIEQEIRLMLTRNGKDLRLLDYLGDLYIRDGQYDRAYETFERRATGEMDSEQLLHDGAERILQKQGEHLKSLMAEVQYYKNIRAPHRALSFLDKYIKCGGENSREIDELEFTLASDSNNNDRAKLAGLKLVSSENPDPKLLMEIAFINAETKDWSNAIERAEAAVKADPENFNFKKSLKDIVRRSKEERLAEIKEQLQTEPTNRKLLHELGDIYHDFDKLNDAVAAYQKASLNDPDQRIARTKLGYVLVKKEMYSDANEVLKDVDIPTSLSQEEQETLKSLLFTIAKVYEETDNEVNALELYRRIFRVDAGYQGVMEQVEKLQHLDKKKNPTI